MFMRKKKTLLNFESKNYVISNNYKSSDLVVANLEYVSSANVSGEPMIERTKQKYIFETIEAHKTIRYREIFTGFIVDTDSQYLDLPYVVNIKRLDEEIPTVANNVTKYGLLLLVNEINAPKKMKVKVSKKNR